LLAFTLARAAEPVRIDWNRARQLRQKQRRGETLTAEEMEYLKQVRTAMRKMPRHRSERARRKVRSMGRDSMNLIPLTDMTAEDTYKGEDGGLYGKGLNRPPKDLQQAADEVLAKIQPLGVNGEASAEGKIVLISIGMSNTTQEFSVFKQIADADKGKSPKVVIVDCAQGGKDVADWVDENSPKHAGVWPEVERRLASAGVSAKQVQVAWLKHARRSPARFGEFPKHVEEFRGQMLKLIQLLKKKFPNLRIVYLSSRIYAGYATTTLNPEPYAYESAFVVRRLIQQQVRGDRELNYDPARGEVKAPLLLWGPYLWANGVKGRKIDDLVYTREDLAGDGTHPSISGRKKVAEQLLKFFKTDPNARGWFLREAVQGESN